MTPSCRALLVHARDFVSTPTPSPPAGGKGDQPHWPRQRPVRWHPPLSGGSRKLSTILLGVLISGFRLLIN